MACLPAGQHRHRSSSTGKVRRLPHHTHPQLLGIAQQANEAYYYEQAQALADEQEAEAEAEEGTNATIASNKNKIHLSVGCLSNGLFTYCSG
jgi:hypothetical protein